VSEHQKTGVLGPVSPHIPAFAISLEALKQRWHATQTFQSHYFITLLVQQVMTRPPYDEARRVFWIVDNCSAHRGAKAAARLSALYPRLTLVHAPVHASWLNQIEIYFSIVQRKVLTPNDFPDLNAVAQRLLDFQYYWEATGKPFEWKFTRQDLTELLETLGNGH
jgi:hypothetical protein